MKLEIREFDIKIDFDRKRIWVPAGGVEEAVNSCIPSVFSNFFTIKGSTHGIHIHQSLSIDNSMTVGYPWEIFDKIIIIHNGEKHIFPDEKKALEILLDKIGRPTLERVSDKIKKLYHQHHQRSDESDGQE